MFKLLIAAALLAGGYVYLSNSPGGRRLRLSSGLSAPSLSPTAGQSVGASAVGLASKIGN